MDNGSVFITLFISILLLSSSIHAATASNSIITTVPFTRGFTPLFGDANVIPSGDDRSVQLHLNQYTGAGFRSSDLYSHGFFSARIQLPSDYTAGIVVAFYTTNGDIFRKAHDELDFEFLGNIRGKAWRFQTNMYGNGSTHRGREERYYLWFDPSKEFHIYSILWTTNTIIFFIDDIPIREIKRHDEMGGEFPSKPMALYATIWDGSDWATSGGKYRANYKYAPFVAEFTDLVLHGCTSDPLEEIVAPVGCDVGDGDQLANVTLKQRLAMKKYRSKYMYYSYCYDTMRYSVPPPECVIDPADRKRFKQTGRQKFNENRHMRRFRKKGQVTGVRSYEIQDEI